MFSLVKVNDLVGENYQATILFAVTYANMQPILTDRRIMHASDVFVSASMPIGGM